jgi:serine/threonine protein kinase
MDLEQGRSLGRYIIQRLIAHGGFSSVYLARDVDLGRDVAIKVSRSIDGEDLELGRILVNEGRILAELQHPSIVTIFDIGKLDEGGSYLVLEYLDGGTLHDSLRDEPNQISRQLLIDILIEVADALDYVHRRGYLHRNIKPRAILQDGGGRPRLSSFEVAVQRAGLKSSVEIAGTPHYMAPEQLRKEAKLLGPHTDVWGFGVTLYEALTGERPFLGAGFQELFQVIPSVSPKEPIAKDPSIPPELNRICMKCLRKDPRERYDHVALLAADLRRWRHLGESAVPEQRVFVSHSTRDREFVEREVIGHLERHGIRTWYSKVAIQTAAEWETSIRRGLESCDWFLVVLSPRSATSEWVKDELHWAIDKRPNRIIPVLIEDCEPRDFHIRMARIQYVDFRRPSPETREQLMRLFAPVALT